MSGLSSRNLPGMAKGSNSLVLHKIHLVKDFRCAPWPVGPDFSTTAMRLRRLAPSEDLRAFSTLANDVRQTLGATAQRAGDASPPMTHRFGRRRPARSEVLGRRRAEDTPAGPSGRRRTRETEGGSHDAAPFPKPYSSSTRLMR